MWFSCGRSVPNQRAGTTGNFLNNLAIFLIDQVKTIHDGQMEY